MDPFFSQPLRLGNLLLPNRVLLAPLAGVSDVPFRRICEELGAGLTYIEMLASTALSFREPRMLEVLRRHQAEPRLGVQLTGSTAADVAHATRRLEDWPLDTVDINMGCPVRKIVGKGWGSAILKEPERVEETVRQTVAACSRPVTAKIRLGYTPQTVNVEDIATRIARAGATMLTIHGRTRDDGYDKPVWYEGIRRGVQAAKAVNPEIIVTGNGDIFDIPSARRMVEETGCDAILVSRGSLGNPWLFGQILRNDPAEPTLSDWRAVIDRHLAYHCELYGDDIHSASRFRKHLLWYVSGFPSSRAVRFKLSTVKALEEIPIILDEYCATLPGHLPRYTSSQEAARLAAGAFDPKYDMDRSLDRAVAE
jgi:nifR3 family TIM-barrel protein